MQMEVEEGSSSCGVSESNSGYSYGDIAASILLEKRTRKAVEDDAEKLYNRVRQLEKEEEKARKRITETKDKTEEILKLRERNEAKVAEKSQRNKQLEDSLEKQRFENLKAKKYSRDAKVKKEVNVLEIKQTIVQQTKGERAEIEKLVAEERLLARRRALEQKEAVRRAQIEAEQKIQSQRNARLQLSDINLKVAEENARALGRVQAHDEYERRLREEVEARIKKEKELSKLIGMEVELIERLKKSQQEQRIAYQQLEAALSVGKRSSRAKRTKSAPSPKQNSNSQVTNSGPVDPSDQEIAQFFANYDAQGTGYIETLHVHSLIRDLGTVLEPQQLKLTLGQLDPKGVGKVSFGEFLLWWKG